MSQPLNPQNRNRRSTMNQEQRADLDRLSLMTERFRQRNLRMARGLEHGFRALEQESTGSARLALSEVK